MSLEDKLKDMERLLNQVIEKQKILEKKIELLESGEISPKNNRVMGFSVVKSKNYFHAVKKVNDVQLRIYIGKDNSRKKVEEKIASWLNKNKWAKDLLPK